MTLARLKWLAIAVPVGVLAGMWVVVHTVVPDLHEHPLLLLTTTVILVASFATGVFWIVGRLEQRIVEQNRELEDRTQELEALLTVGRAASSSLELGELLDAATDATREVTGADAAEVWLRSGSGELVLSRRTSGDGDVEGGVTRLQPGEGLPGAAVTSGAPVVVPDLASDARAGRESLLAQGLRAYSALPLRHRGDIVGVLGIGSKETGRLSSERELELLSGIGERVALAIANARLYERVLDSAVVEERMRIARELHDGLAQVLGYINTQTLAVKRLLAAGRSDAARDELDSMEHAARDVYADVREAILGLRQSLPRQGLVPALRGYLAEYTPMAGVRTTLDASEAIQELELQPELEIQLMRIAQEALANVRKHAHATTAVVRLSLEGDLLVLEVTDDGEGFDEAATTASGWPRFGLQTMRERAHAVGGELDVVSSHGSGTTVRMRVRVPVPQEAGHAARAG